MLTRLRNNPKLIFKLDGLGALASSMYLGVLLPYTQPIWGIPMPVLYSLASLAVLFTLYDAAILLLGKHPIKPNYVLWIMMANIGYMICSIIVAMYFRHNITVWGWLYLGVEKLIVLSIVLLELKLYVHLKKTDQTSNF